jgi:hypothetical protein
MAQDWTWTRKQAGRPCADRMGSIAPGCDSIGESLDLAGAAPSEHQPLGMRVVTQQLATPWSIE